MSSHDETSRMSSDGGLHLICSSFAIAIAAMAGSTDPAKDDLVIAMHKSFAYFCPDPMARQSYIESAKYSILDYRSNNDINARPH